MRLAVELAADVEVPDILEGALAHGAEEAFGVDGLAADLDKDTAEKENYELEIFNNSGNTRVS